MQRVLTESFRGAFGKYVKRIVAPKCFNNITREAALYLEHELKALLTRGTPTFDREHTSVYNSLHSDISCEDIAGPKRKVLCAVGCESDMLYFETSGLDIVKA